MTPGFSLVPARKQGFTLIHPTGMALSSRVDPIQEGDRLVSPVGIRPEDVVLVLGFSPIYHLQAILSLQILSLPNTTGAGQKPGTGGGIFLLEKDEALRAQGEALYSRATGETTFPWNGLIFDPEISSPIFDALDAKGVNPNRVKVLVADRTNPQAYGAFLEKLKIWISDRLKRATTEAAFGRRWLRNAKRNSRLKPIHFLSEKSISTPDAVLISSGPGLEGNLETLRSLRGKCHFYALPGASVFLGRNGIGIDTFIATDGGYWNLAHFEGACRGHRGADLIAPFSIYGAIPPRFSQTHFFFDDEAFAKTWPEPETAAANWIPQAGTAVNVALTVMAKLGHRKILTAGIDFSLTPWRCHAPSNITEERFFSSCNRLIPFDTSYHRAFSMKILRHPDGEGRWTDEKLELYRRLYENQKKQTPIPVNALSS